MLGDLEEPISESMPHAHTQQRGAFDDAHTILREREKRGGAHAHGLLHVEPKITNEEESNMHRGHWGQRWRVCICGR